MKYTSIALALVLALLCTGCPTARKTSEADDGGGAQVVAAPPPTGVSFAAVDAKGNSVLATKQTDKGFQLSGTGADGSLKIAGNEILLLDPKGQARGKVICEADKITLKDAAGKKLYKLTPKEGGYRLKDARDEIVLKIKPKEGDFKVNGPTGNTLGKVKPKNGKIVINDPNGTRLYTITGMVKPDALGVLLFDKLTPLQKAALIMSVGAAPKAK